MSCIASPILRRASQPLLALWCSKNIIPLQTTYIATKTLCTKVSALDIQLSTSSSSGDSSSISKAAKSYLERATSHSNFMKEKMFEYDIGKRHLANMMGENPDTFTQDDVDEAIRYLFPSGLFEPKARPMMKPPEEVFPKQKEAQFDIHGRPFHHLFYTGFPVYFDLLRDISIKAERLNEEHDKMRKDPHKVIPVLNISDSKWMTLEQFGHRIMENINEPMYKFFLLSMERLAAHPCASLEQDFVKNYRIKVQLSVAEEFPELMYTDLGVPYMSASSWRKTSNATVTVYGKGTGKININGKDILYFENIQDRNQIMFPLKLSGLMWQVDIEAHVEGGGTTGQSGVIRYSLARALCSFVDGHKRDVMRIAGLLTHDRRIRERKKIGQPKARAKKKWRKR